MDPTTSIKPAKPQQNNIKQVTDLCNNFLYHTAEIAKNNELLIAGHDFEKISSISCHDLNNCIVTAIRTLEGNKLYLSAFEIIDDISSHITSIKQKQDEISESDIHDIETIIAIDWHHYFLEKFDNLFKIKYKKNNDINLSLKQGNLGIYLEKYNGELQDITGVVNHYYSQGDKISNHITLHQSAQGKDGPIFDYTNNHESVLAIKDKANNLAKLISDSLGTKILNIKNSAITIPKDGPVIIDNLSYDNSTKNYIYDNSEELDRIATSFLNLEPLPHNTGDTDTHSPRPAQEESSSTQCVLAPPIPDDPAYDPDQSPDTSASIPNKRRRTSEIQQELQPMSVERLLNNLEKSPTPQ